jgi:ferredoxin
MRFDIAIAPHPDRFACRDDQTVLEAMSGAGRAHIRIGCRGGGCGICRVRVLAGRFRTGVMSRAQVSEEQQAQGYALACRLYPLDDLTLQLAPKQSSAAAESVWSLWRSGVPSSPKRASSTQDHR